MWTCRVKLIANYVARTVPCSVVRQQVIVLFDLHFKDSSAFTIGFIYLQFARFVFRMCAVKIASSMRLDIVCLFLSFSSDGRHFDHLLCRAAT